MDKPEYRLCVPYSQNIVAAGTITRLEFQDREDPDWSALDDISVTLAATPEPGTTFLGLGAALFSLVAVRFRKRHSGRSQTED